MTKSLSGHKILPTHIRQSVLLWQILLLGHCGRGIPAPIHRTYPPLAPASGGKKDGSASRRRKECTMNALLQTALTFPDTTGTEGTTTMCVGNNYQCSPRRPLLESLASVLPFYCLLIFRNHYKQGPPPPALHI